MRTMLFVIGCGVLISIFTVGGFIFAATMGSPRTSGLGAVTFTLLYWFVDLIFGILFAYIVVVTTKINLRLPDPMPGAKAIAIGFVLFVVPLAFTLLNTHLGRLGIPDAVFALAIYGSKIAGYLLIAIGVVHAFLSAARAAPPKSLC